MNILNLPAFAVHKVEEREFDVETWASYAPQPSACPRCGVAGGALYRHGVKQQKIWDVPTLGKRSRINLQRQRWKCRECEQTFFEVIPELDDSRSMTLRLREYIERQSVRETFVKVADDVGVVEGTVRQVFHAYVERMEQQHQFVTPRWLGLDEVYILKKPRLIVTNVEERSLVELLPNRWEKTVTNYLTDLDNKDRITIVAMDMWDQYRTAVRKVLPDAAIVVDKWHVLKWATVALDRMRIEIQKGLPQRQRRTLKKVDRWLFYPRWDELEPRDQLALEAWFGAYPPLRDAYQANEGFYDFYAAPSRQEAERLLEEWEKGLSPGTRAAFKGLLTAMKNWREEVLCYFDCRVTNAFTEAFNRTVKEVNRKGRGYSFEVLRARLLFSTGEHKIRKPKFRESWAQPDQELDFGVSVDSLPAEDLALLELWLLLHDLGHGPDDIHTNAAKLGLTE